MKKLSICIPCLNNWIFTSYCLTNFQKLNRDDYEVIVVDNGSVDMTEEGVKKFDMDLKYIKNDKNLGFGKAQNQAYAASSGRCVMFLNNDIKIQDKNFVWLDKFVDVVLLEDVILGPTGGYVDIKNDFEFCYETTDIGRKINYMSGWCLTAKREVWELLKLSGQEGPFDAKTFFVYFEDTDLTFRADELKIKYRIHPLPIVHIGKQTSRNLNISKLYEESRKKFISRWG